MPVTEFQYDEVEGAEQKVETAIQEHQVNIGKGVRDGIGGMAVMRGVCMMRVMPVAPLVIAQQDLHADDDKVQRSTYKDEYLFAQAFHASKIIRKAGLS